MTQIPDIISRPLVGKLSILSMLALAGITGPVILYFADLFTGFSSPEYSFIRDSISSLVWAPLGWVQTIGFLAIGLLVELFVAGLFFSIRAKWGFGLGLFILALFGFGLLVIGAFHTDPVNSPTTFEGTLHEMAARGVFWLFPFATFLIAPSLKSNYWKSLFIYNIAAGVFAILFMTIPTFVTTTNNWFGLFERILTGDETVWVEIMSIWLLRLSLNIQKSRI